MDLKTNISVVQVQVQVEPKLQVWGSAAAPVRLINIEMECCTTQVGIW